MDTTEKPAAPPVPVPPPDTTQRHYSNDPNGPKQGTVKDEKPKPDSELRGGGGG